MNRVSIIIYDNYKNVLIIQKEKARKGESPLWSLPEREMKGKETPEKCIMKAIEKDLNNIIFDLDLYRTIDEGSEDCHYIFSGVSKGKLLLHKSLYDMKWVNVSDLDQYQFAVNMNVNVDIKEIVGEFINGLTNG